VRNEAAIGSVSPITLVHAQPPGRYYKLEDGGDWFAVSQSFVWKAVHRGSASQFPRTPPIQCSRAVVRSRCASTAGSWV
jgi:hypothetical protein